MNNEQDKKAFEEYKNKFHGNMSPNNDDYGNRDSGFKNGWQAACEYKQKEIDQLKNLDQKKNNLEPEDE